ncbi:MAG: NAD(P)H-hydrate dehydratase [Phycisphaeraceae bacterium]|nr:NAD(P)H-hydrate dehydratase [Phycisphaeraceae bacterium]
MNAKETMAGLERVTADGLTRLPARPADAHKGTFGTVIVVGGCSTMLGAPAIAARGALRGGAGLVKIATLPGVLPWSIVIEPGATGICVDWEADPAAAVSLIEAADPQGKAVLAVGPGLGASDEAGEVARALWAKRGTRRIVLDADGLNHLAKAKHSHVQQDAEPHGVMTPHPGEFTRLAASLGITEIPTDESQRIPAAVKLARAYGAVVALKGHRTVVTDGRCVYVNDTGNPALATAGSGDVLTGLIAALLAQGLDEFNAAALGVRLHGKAGDLWAATNGSSGLRAVELADLLTAAATAKNKTSPYRSA